jgi:two-component system osmolarity sensor histidine kinase EnvZ
MLNKFIPSSLFVRFILIIVLPTIFAQLIATYIFYNRHWHSVSKNMSHSLANDIRVVAALQKLSLPLEQKKIIYQSMSIDVNIIERRDQDKAVDFHPSETDFLHSILKGHFPYPIQISFIDDHDSIKIEIFQLQQILSFTTNSKRVDNPTTYIFILWMTGTSLMFLLLSIIFTKNQIRPIIKLARAADKFGKGQSSLFFKPEGAKEVRKAAIAFLKMKERIERQIQYRTEMLAGVSHDLRTPLTRMKLQLAISKDSDTLLMLEDIHDMEYMINAFIDFARGDNKETTKLVSIVTFLKQVTSPYLKQNLNCSIIKTPNIKIPLKTNAIKRCFQNLLDNAFKYSSATILNSYIDNEELYIELHDNGPGISEEKREAVFEPFFRLDTSRNKENGGIGLGLAITRDIISNHGGRINLGTSELLKGLKVTIVLPL